VPSFHDTVTTCMSVFGAVSLPSVIAAFCFFFAFFSF
jgi:hypothetical protein